MNYSIDTEQENGGRLIAEVPELPGVMAYEALRERTPGSVPRSWP